MSLKLNSSGGGSVTLQEPTTASDFTLTLPAQTATVITDSSAILNIGSGQIYKDASGNVGIGTTSPVGVAGTKLDVRGSITAGATGTGRASLEQGISTNSGYLALWNADLTVRQGYVGYATLAGGGTFNIATDTNNSLHFLTNGTLRAAIDTNGTFYFNSGYGSVAVAYGCRAWVNYNATGSSTRASGGLSSVTKNGTGDYTLNFSNTMPDTNYSVVATANAYNNYQGLVVCIQSMSTTSVNLRNTQGNNASAAEGNISGGAASVLCVSIFR